MLKGFKEFAMKGNVIDLAVGVIIGASFGNIVKSLVDDIIMPPLGVIIGRVDFKNLFIVIQESAIKGPYHTLDEAVKAGAVILRYGLFINTIVSFLIVAFSVYLLISWFQRLTKKEDKKSEPIQPSDEVKLLSEIRDLLKK
jgi:large conductance mechanosensitive channel